ncbi:MAG: hypothetical protein KatS3mg082_1484 [Nitrospiraceae bacterium]|nr:MAG: hypothetical protein KatS3mg082_1484 [Nitrospiraceae bacterium]
MQRPWHAGKAEQEQIRTALAEDSRLRLWRTSFIEPVRGAKTGVFGSVRVLNGQPRSPHSGEDIGAPLGTEVVASNDGVVRLTVDHFFSGKGIFLDHGLGLYSMYFHLSEVLVRDGDLVKAGQVIGKVGATGRATGPHLHWGRQAQRRTGQSLRPPRSPVPPQRRRSRSDTRLCHRSREGITGKGR